MGVYGDLIIIHPKAYSMYLRGTIYSQLPEKNNLELHLEKPTVPPKSQYDALLVWDASLMNPIVLKTSHM